MDWLAILWAIDNDRPGMMDGIRNAYCGGVVANGPFKLPGLGLGQYFRTKWLEDR